MVGGGDVIVADAEEPLVVLTVTAEMLRGVPELGKWIEAVGGDIFANGVGGVDSSVITRAAEIGIDVAAAVAPTKQKGRKAASN